MGRTPCCSGEGLKKGTWADDEDRKLVDYITEHGEGGWRSLPQKAGNNVVYEDARNCISLWRCGKSCRLRWANYLKPGIKRGEFGIEEEETIIRLHSTLGNKWSTIAKQLRGRTDNEIKNHWNTRLKRLADEWRIKRNEARNSSEVPENCGTNAEADNTTSKLQEVNNSGKSKASISTSSKLLNEVAAKLRASGSLASLMSQQVGTSKSPKGRSIPSASSASLLNKMATTLSLSSPKSHSLDAIKAMFSKSLEGGVSCTSSDGINGLNSEKIGISNSNTPQSENAVQVSRQTTLSASARLLNRMGTKLALTRHRPHLLVGDSRTVSNNSPDQERIRTESLASEPSLLMRDLPQQFLSHFDGNNSGTCHHQDMVIESDGDPPFLTEIDDHDHDDQKERNDQNIVCEYDQLESFLNGNDSDEVYMTIASPSPVEVNIAYGLEAAHTWNDFFN
ncbi:hypothetical protein TIFTF001_042559 [Ficus carica]|uniref:Uncharacterized protein n=1 Tax=Ficus carica TaxID=3494 RepID=A0AA87ZP28_FICCA|nr:hypothetical protein TIFTF001_042554 [Ficus carica]GMN37009.1 hypothetical protein TIFTF001_042559 [Ficus carica]